MLVQKIKKTGLTLRREALVAGTSLEIFKQRRVNEITRVRGRVYAKQHLSSAIKNIFLDAGSFVVVVKCVETGADWTTFVNTLSARNLKVDAILPINNIQTLYASLSVGASLHCLTTYLASSSVYLLVAPNFDAYLGLVKHTLNYETLGGSNFFELLFMKEKNNFIDLTSHSANSFASDLRALYLTRTRADILLELNSCIFSIPSILSAVFSISLVSPSSAIYPTKL